MRLELPDGQWADLRERLNYGPARDVRRAYVLVNESVGNAVNVDIELVKAYVSAWNVLDADGHAVAIEEPEKANDEAIQIIALEASKVWNKKASPKGSRKTSPSTLRALESSSTATA